MSISKRIEEARRAFASGDEAAAAQAHSAEAIRHAAQEDHGGAGEEYLREMVYGGLDGIITTFAVVSGVAGAQLGTPVVLILGLANLLADGFSMATGAYLSSKSEHEYYQKEWQREAWEVEHFPEAERAELVELYVARGYEEEEASSLVEIQSRDEERWIKTMMVEELGLLHDDGNPLLDGLATLISFVVAGSMPLLIYVAALFMPVAREALFPTALVLSAVALFGLGVAKALVTRRGKLASGLEMLLVGGLAAVVAYVVGALLKGIGA